MRNSPRIVDIARAIQRLPSVLVAIFLPIAAREPVSRHENNDTVRGYVSVIPGNIVRGMHGDKINGRLFVHQRLGRNGERIKKSINVNDERCKTYTGPLEDKLRLIRRRGRVVKGVGHLDHD